MISCFICGLFVVIEGSASGEEDRENNAIGFTIATPYEKLQKLNVDWTLDTYAVSHKTEQEVKAAVGFYLLGAVNIAFVYCRRFDIFRVRN